MTLQEITNQVRWCVDEESGYGEYEDTYFDNIVKAKISTALRWCALYADAALINGSDTPSGNTLSKDYNVGSEGGLKYSNGYITLPEEAVRVVRVRAPQWHKGVSSFVAEDSDEYLMQSDDIAKATNDRPVAALILSNPMKVQVFPAPESPDGIEISIVESPSSATIMGSAEQGEDVISIPPKLESAFIYYLAYLVMCAHSDSNKASLMLGIAKEQIAIQQQK